MTHRTPVRLPALALALTAYLVAAPALAASPAAPEQAAPEQAAPMQAAPVQAAPESAALAPSPTLSTPLDLSSAVDLALVTNPGVKAVEELRTEVAAGIREAWGEALPELDLVSSWSRSRNPAFLNSPDFANLLDLFPEGDFTPSEQELWRLVVELRQPVFTWGKIGAGVQLARLVADIAEARIDTARLDVGLSTAEAYYGLLGAEESLATVEIQQQVRREALEVVEARYEIGEATRLELLRSQAALAEVEPTVVSIRGAVEVARQRLRTVLGADVDAAELEVTSVSEEPSPPPPADELLTVALAERPELADLALESEARGMQGKILAANGKPQVDLFGSYGREVRLLDNLTDPLYQDWSVALTMRWQFFDGGKRKNAQAQLDSQARQLDWQRRQLVDQVRLEIETAHTAYATAHARWQAATTAAEAAEEASRVADESYREGVALQADLLDAQQREVLAELARVEAYYETLVEAARLDRAIGRLPGGRELPPSHSLEPEGPQATPHAATGDGEENS